MPKLQQGTSPEKSGKWLGHFSRWTRDAQGQRKRLQQAFVIGECDRMTLTRARRVLRQRLEEELGLRKASHRIEVGWFIEQRWKPLREGKWRDSTKKINELFLTHIKRQFGEDLLRECDEVEMQAWLNSLVPGLQREHGSAHSLFVKKHLHGSSRAGLVNALTCPSFTTPNRKICKQAFPDRR